MSYIVIIIPNNIYLFRNFRSTTNIFAIKKLENEEKKERRKKQKKGGREERDEGTSFPLYSLNAFYF